MNSDIPDEAKKAKDVPKVAKHIYKLKEKYNFQEDDIDLEMPFEVVATYLADGDPSKLVR